MPKSDRPRPIINYGRVSFVFERGTMDSRGSFQYRFPDRASVSPFRLSHGLYERWKELAFKIAETNEWGELLRIEIVEPEECYPGE